MYWYAPEGAYRVYLRDIPYEWCQEHFRAALEKFTGLPAYYSSDERGAWKPNYAFSAPLSDENKRKIETFFRTVGVPLYEQRLFAAEEYGHPFNEFHDAATGQESGEYDVDFIAVYHEEVKWFVWDADEKSPTGTSFDPHAFVETFRALCTDSAPTIRDRRLKVKIVVLDGNGDVWFNSHPKPFCIKDTQHE